MGTLPSEILGITLSDTTYLRMPFAISSSWTQTPRQIQHRLQRPIADKSVDTSKVLDGLRDGNVAIRLQEIIPNQNHHQRPQAPTTCRRRGICIPLVLSSMWTETPQSAYYPLLQSFATSRYAISFIHIVDTQPYRLYTISSSSPGYLNSQQPIKTRHLSISVASKTFARTDSRQIGRYE